MIPAKSGAVVPQSTIEDVITKGDLSKLTPDQRTEYYTKLCHSLGLNPLTQPFSWLNLNGKLVLYANRSCADQLRKINGIHINIVSQEQSDGLLTIHVKAKDQDGREDEDLGVVSLPDNLKGEARANTILKAVTKAKRRVTLSISGLGFLDETEVEDIPAQAKAEPQQIAITPPTPAAAALIEAVKQETVPTSEPHEIVLGDTPDWAWFGREMIRLAGLPDWPDWYEKNEPNIRRLEKEAPKIYAFAKAGIQKAQGEKPRRGRPPKTKVPTLKEDPEGYLKWLEIAVKEVSDFYAFTASQADVIAAGFPSDQQAAKDILARHAPK